MYGGMRVLVTGGTGTIGPHVVARLQAAGAHVTVASLDTPARAAAVLSGEYDFQRLDLRESANCMEAVRDQDMVIHLMAVKGNTQRGLSAVASAYVPFLQCNTNMMEAAFRSNVRRYLFVGSIGQYPALALRREDDVWKGAPEANDKYMGIAKRAGEAQAEAYLHEHGWDAVRIVRLSNVYGPFDDFDPQTAHVIPALIARALTGENPLRVAGDGTAVRDFIYVEDVADGMLLALAKAPACLPINLGSGRGVTIREVAETVSSLAPGHPVLQWETDRPTGDSVRVLATERAREVLGFAAKTPLHSGIERTMQWFTQHPELALRRGKELHA